MKNDKNKNLNNNSQKDDWINIEIKNNREFTGAFQFK